MRKDIFEISDQQMHRKLLRIEAEILTVLLVHIVAIVIFIFFGW